MNEDAPVRHPSSARSLVFVVPTRNRPDLARNAVRSVLGQKPAGVRIIVSDNSTSPEAAVELTEFCRTLTDQGVAYMRPPEPLSMTRHYDWAIRQILQAPDVTHIGLLTDRMVFKAGQFAEVVAAASAYPDHIFTYSHDRLVDFAEPVTLEQHLWTGQIVKLNSARLLALSARALTHTCLPRMMNCIVPRGVFEALERRYGNLFDSIAPDFNFCYRALERCDEIVYYDAQPLVHYALSRSNGESQARGIASKDHLDFIANLGGKTFNYAAPVPGIMTVGNAIMHEYCFVQQETGGSVKLPTVDRPAYLQQMAAEVEALENPELREEMRRLLAEEGWRGPAPRRSIWHRLAAFAPGKFWRRVSEFLRTRASSPRLRGLWDWTARRLGFYPPVHVVKLRFANRTAALDFASRHPRPRQSQRFILDYLQREG